MLLMIRIIYCIKIEQMPATIYNIYTADIHKLVDTDEHADFIWVEMFEGLMKNGFYFQLNEGEASSGLTINCDTQVITHTVKTSAQDMENHTFILHPSGITIKIDVDTELSIIDINSDIINFTGVYLNSDDASKYETAINLVRYLKGLEIKGMGKALRNIDLIGRTRELPENVSALIGKIGFGKSGPLPRQVKQLKENLERIELAARRGGNRTRKNKK